MQRKIIVRFVSEENLKETCNKLNLDLSTMTKSVDLTNKTFLNKRKTFTRECKEEWMKYWVNMPKYFSGNIKPYAEIIFYIDNVSEFEKLFSQKITPKTKYIFYPKIKLEETREVVLGGDNPQYPVYIVSKGRWNQCLTSKCLTRMNVPHYVVVEPQEYDKYVNTLGADKVLMLDMSYKNDYDAFDDLGNTKSKGPGGARNFCWQHSIDNGYKWHWVMDDNIREFYMLNNNMKIKSRTGGILNATEKFVECYSNIAIAGLNYEFLAKRKQKLPPFVLNTRIYSCLLIRNDIPYRWRGRYNEDTDLSLRALKDGWCTIQLNFFLAKKIATQRMKGGNTEEFYAKEGTMPKSQMLQDMHPDVSKVVWKFNRWHHYVDYSVFRENYLQFNDNINKENNNHGIYVVQVAQEHLKNDRKFLENLYKENIF